jgi:hypothetical protein
MVNGGAVIMICGIRLLFHSTDLHRPRNRFRTGSGGIPGCRPDPVGVGNALAR